MRQQGKFGIDHSWEWKGKVNDEINYENKLYVTLCSFKPHLFALHHEVSSDISPALFLFLLPIFRYGSKLIIDQEMTGGSLLIVSSLPSCLMLWSWALISSYSRHVLPPYVCFLLFIYPSLHLYIHVSTLPSVFLSICSPSHLNVHPSVHSYPCLSVPLSVWPSFPPSVRPSVPPCLSLFPFPLPLVFLSLHPSTHPSIHLVHAICSSPLLLHFLSYVYPSLCPLIGSCLPPSAHPSIHPSIHPFCVILSSSFWLLSSRCSFLWWWRPCNWVRLGHISKP